MSWARIIDCGDIPISPFDNELAVRQMNDAFFELGSRPEARTDYPKINTTSKGPKLLIFGGDHSIALPSLRALHKIHEQPIAVVHFDAHLDTLHPTSYPSQWNSAQTEFTHGSMFWQASNEGLVLPGSSIHVGLRTRLTGDNWDDYTRDDAQGYLRVTTDDVDKIGTDGIVQAIIDRVGTKVPTYLSIDIDVIDPGMAPGTGAPEAGGWTMREMNRIVRGLRDLNIVGADIVEVAPAYDDRSESTGLAAAQLAYEILTNFVKHGMPEAVEKPAEVSGDSDSHKTEL
ncbi:MAG: hypothetical protein M1825_005784 [Sarcosagium campestre]|nr:MAG: hypothetical protein M1825_005784 [Sarcosagium campestre]